MNIKQNGKQNRNTRSSRNKGIYHDTLVQYTQYKAHVREIIENHIMENPNAILDIDSLNEPEKDILSNWSKNLVVFSDGDDCYIVEEKCVDKFKLVKLDATVDKCDVIDLYTTSSDEQEDDESSGDDYELSFINDDETSEDEFSDEESFH